MFRKVFTFKWRLRAWLISQLFYHELSRKEIWITTVKGQLHVSSPFLTTPTLPHTYIMTACECHWLKTGPAIYQTSLKQETIGMGIFTPQLVALRISIASFNFKHKREDKSWKHRSLYPMTSFLFQATYFLEQSFTLVPHPWTTIYWSNTPLSTEEENFLLVKWNTGIVRELSTFFVPKKKKKNYVNKDKTKLNNYWEQRPFINTHSPLGCSL